MKEKESANGFFFNFILYMKLKKRKKKCVNERERISKWIFFNFILYMKLKERKKKCVNERERISK
jgi:hypothetical protein